MRVLVTGGLGYLGSHLVEKLKARGFDVTIFDSNIYPNSDPAWELNLTDDGLRLIREDIREKPALTKAVSEADVVVHLAAIVGDEACNLDPERAVAVNYLATRQLAMLCESKGKPMVFTSTCSVYGAKQGVIQETDDVTPLSIYGMSKLAAEEAVRKACPDSTVLRLGTLYGLSRRMRFDLVINRMVGQAVREGKIAVFGGTQWRPFLHVQDAAEGLARVVDSPRPGSYNVGGANHQISDVANRIGEHVDCAVVAYKELQDRRTYFVSSELAERELGIHFKWDLDTGIKEVRDVLVKRNHLDYKDPMFSNAAWLGKK